MFTSLEHLGGHIIKLGLDLCEQIFVRILGVRGLVPSSMPEVPVPSAILCL